MRDVWATDRVPGARSRHCLVTACLTLATAAALVAVFAVWINRQALDTNRWTHTSGRFLADRSIDRAIGDYLVAQLFTAVDVRRELRTVLPQPLESLAAPAASRLRRLGDRLVPRVLASPPVQRSWRAANRATHLQLLQMIDGGGRVVSSGGGVVMLDLRALVTALAVQLKRSSQLPAIVGSGAARLVSSLLIARLGPQAGRLVILRSGQLRTVQGIAAVVRGLALLAPVLALGLFAAAVGLARGRRRRVLRAAGLSLSGVGAVVLVARPLLGHVLIDSLISAPGTRRAGYAAWEIGTTLLRDMAAAVLIAGGVVAAVAWLAKGRSGSLQPRRAPHRVLASGTSPGYGRSSKTG